MTELAHESTGYAVVEEEPPELLTRNLRSAGHLWAGTTAFFFAGFVFAFFYLRSLNNAHMWHPKGVSPPLGLGTAIIVCVLVSVVLTWLGLRERRAATGGKDLSPQLDDARLWAWRRRGMLALGFGVAAVVLQCVEYATLGFGPTQGGLASVFVGWTGMFIVFVVGAMFWLETLLATSVRYRKRQGIAPGEGAGDPYRTASDVSDPLVLVLPGLEAMTFFWTVLGAIGLIAYILLYAVK
jgi:heme/copper-type cytochrome/quinol oxidase subunit 3